MEQNGTSWGQMSLIRTSLLSHQQILKKIGKNSCSTLYKIIEPSKSLSFVHSEMTFGCSIKSNNGTSALIRIVWKKNEEIPKRSIRLLPDDLRFMAYLELLLMACCFSYCVNASFVGNSKLYQNITGLVQKPQMKCPRKT